ASGSGRTAPERRVGFLFSRGHIYFGSRPAAVPAWRFQSSRGHRRARRSHLARGHTADFERRQALTAAREREDYRAPTDLSKDGEKRRKRGRLLGLARIDSLARHDARGHSARLGGAASLEGSSSTGAVALTCCWLSLCFDFFFA